MPAIKVTDQNFENEVLQSSQTVLVDFWAPWCGPCRSVAPAVDELAEELDGEVKIVKLNIDDSPKTAVQYQVQSIPTFLVFNEGEVVNRISGAVAKSKLQNAVTQFVS